MRISDWSSDVCSSDLAAARVNLADRVGDFLATHFHIVVGADAHGGDRALRADDMLHRGDHFLGEAAVGDEDHSQQRPCFIDGPEMQDPYACPVPAEDAGARKSTRLTSSH